MDNWKRIIFNGKLRIWISQGNVAETFVYGSNKTYKETDKENKYISQVISQDCMSFEESKEITITTPTSKPHVSIEILDYVLISPVENWFGDCNVIFQYDNASCHRAKGIKLFFK